jgi:hypothetical protein
VPVHRAMLFPKAVSAFSMSLSLVLALVVRFVSIQLLEFCQRHFLLTIIIDVSGRSGKKSTGLDY